MAPAAPEHEVKPLNPPSSEQPSGAPHVRLVVACLVAMVLLGTLFQKPSNEGGPLRVSSTSSEPNGHSIWEVDLPTPNVTKGFLKHPSYYTDRYLPRAASQPDTAKWGSWTMPDTRKRPSTDVYAPYPSRDIPFQDLPKDAWQRDSDYVKEFLAQGLALGT